MSSDQQLMRMKATIATVQREINDLKQQEIDTQKLVVFSITPSIETIEQRLSSLEKVVSDLQKQLTTSTSIT